MAISHVCTSCGTDLARIRSPIDPLYRLRIVTCPRCSTSSVRRGLRDDARWIRSAIQAANLLARRLVFGAILLAISAYGAAWLAGELSEQGLTCVSLAATLASSDSARSEWARSLVMEQWFVTGVMLVAVSWAAGMWLPVALRHWRLIAACAVWACLLAIIGTADVWYRSAVSLLSAFGSGGGSYAGPSAQELLIRAQILAGMLSVTLAVIPVGVALRRIDDSQRRTVWRRRLSRARRRRANP